jgi:hypothetical protein
MICAISAKSLYPTNVEESPELGKSSVAGYVSDIEYPAGLVEPDHFKQPTHLALFHDMDAPLPLSNFMNGLMLSTATRRKSERAISTLVSYARDSARDGETLLVTSKTDRTWWRNLRGGAAITMLINGKSYRADATVIEDRATVERERLRFFRAVERTIGGIHLDKDGQPTKPDKFAQVVQSRVMIEITHLTPL